MRPGYPARVEKHYPRWIYSGRQRILPPQDLVGGPKMDVSNARLRSYRTLEFLVQSEDELQR